MKRSLGFRHPFLAALLLIATARASAQNLFPKKLDNCNTEHFCLDCGDVKAGVDTVKLAQLVQSLVAANNLRGVNGKLLFQILVDANGRGCVLSHTDVSDNVISRNIVAALNRFDGFRPATTQGKKEERTSFNMSFEIGNGAISARVERVDADAFRKSFDKPNMPEIYNKSYRYRNEHLNNYTITVWDAQHSTLPNNQNDHITIDDKGIVWLESDGQLVRFDGKSFVAVWPPGNLVSGNFNVYALASDHQNRKWVYGTRQVFSYDNARWNVYEPKATGLRDVSRIVFNKKTGELFFCASSGLTIFKDGAWTQRNSDNQYPFGDVYFAQRDSKNRIWIGTFDGSYRIEADGTCTSFNAIGGVLSGQCITAMDEDDNGNLYFCLFEYGAKPGTVNRNDGIALFAADGTSKQYTTSNSGMPFNNATDVLYDRKEKVLWISTDRAGLVRYDLKDNWENYHPGNSAIPTSYISQMAFDNNGVLYLATRQGLVRVARK